MLISIIGINGAGKTTQAKLLANNLNKRGLASYFSEAYGDLERKSLDKFFRSWSSKTITLVYQGLFCEQCERAKQEIKEGKIVVAAGWNESFMAHHTQFGYLSKKDNLRRSLNLMTFDNIKPDITFFLNISVKKTSERMKRRKDGFFDKRGAGYYQTIGKYYRKISKKKKWIVIDGEMGIRKINEKIINHVLKFV